MFSSVLTLNQRRSKKKDKMKFLIEVIIILTCLTYYSSSKQLSRQKRFFIMPPGGPTRHQFICGVGIPVALEFESVTTGYVLKAQYFLPDSVNDLKWEWASPEKINAPGTPLRKRSLPDNSTAPVIYSNITEYIDPETGEHVEKYEGEIEQIDLKSIDVNADIDLDYSKDYAWRSNYIEDKSLRNTHSRWTLYKIFEGMLNTKSLDGRECLKRIICESAAIKFGHENGILGELVRIILSPSSTGELHSHVSDEDFTRAEELGKKQKPCELYYSKCHVSLIEIFSKIL